MKVFVLGYKGMLGRYVYDYLYGKYDEVIGFDRRVIDAGNMGETALRSVLFHNRVEKGDVLINCIGTIKPMVDKHGTLNAVKVNSVFPHLLADVCQEKGYKLIHITTDCVFSGNDGSYTETSPHDALDVYGKSKSLGEPSNCTVLRTSIIGEEVGTSRSLIEWVKSEHGHTVNGFTNHQWNGLTCHQTAKVFHEIIQKDLYWEGVRHVFSPNSLSKLELVTEIAKAHNVQLTVNPMEAGSKCDRTLSTVFEENGMFNIPTIQEQLKEQYENPPTVSEDEI